MTEQLPKELELLIRGRAAIEAVLRQSHDPTQRATQLTMLLRSLWPDSVLYACRYRDAHQYHFHVENHAGTVRTDWAKLLQDTWTTEGKNQNGFFIRKLPRSLKLPGQQLVVGNIEVENYHGGELALAVHEKPLLHLIGVQLAACAQHLALYRLVEVQQEALNEQTQLAERGELAGPVAHAVNNFLYALTLQLAVLDLKFPGELQSELEKIRQQGAALTTLVKLFQKTRKQHPSVLRALDLNQIVNTVVAQFHREQAASSDSAVLQLQLTPNLPLLRGSAADLHRLITFLLRYAMSVSESRGEIVVRTEAAPDRVVFHLEDSGPPLPAELLAPMLESGLVERNGIYALELVACKSLAQRFQGTLHAAIRAAGGVVFRLELPLASR